MNWTKYLHGWQGCFLLALMAFVMQALSPLAAVIMLFMFAPFWPVILVNLGFVLMIVSIVRGRTDKRWAIAPILYFGVYYLAALVSQIQAYRFEASVTAQAASAPAQMIDRVNLVIGPDDEGAGSDLTARTLIDQYGIKTVFLSYARQQGSTSSVQMTQLVNSDCLPLSDYPDGVQGLSVSRGGYPSGKPQQRLSGYCIETRAVDAAEADITILSGAMQDFTLPLRGRYQTMAIRVAGQPQRSIVTGMTLPLPWIPMPVAGCHFKGGFGDTWDDDCHAYFESGSFLGVRNSAASDVASALGLKLAPLAERFPDNAWTNN